MKKKLIIIVTLIVICLTLTAVFYLRNTKVYPPLENPLTAQQAFDKIKAKYYKDINVIVSYYHEGYSSLERLENKTPKYFFTINYRLENQSNKSRNRTFSVDSMTGKITTGKSQRIGSYTNKDAKPLPDGTYDMNKYIGLIDEELGFSVIDAVYNNFSLIYLHCHKSPEQMNLIFVGEIPSGSGKTEPIISFTIYLATDEVTYSEQNYLLPDSPRPTPSR